MSVKNTLIAARALITDPDRWTKNAMARDAEGFRVRVMSTEAVCFCTLGAVLRASCGAGYAKASSILRRQLPADIDVDKFNDDPKTTHADVLALFDKAIADAM